MVGNIVPLLETPICIRSGLGTALFGQNPGGNRTWTSLKVAGLTLAPGVVTTSVKWQEKYSLTPVVKGTVY